MRSGKQFVNTLEDNIRRCGAMDKLISVSAKNEISHKVKDILMNRRGAPAHCWLLTLQYVSYILNHISTASLGGQVPLQVLYGVTPDISIILLYTF